MISDLESLLHGRLSKCAYFRPEASTRLSVSLQLYPGVSCTVLLLPMRMILTEGRANKVPLSFKVDE